VAVLAIQAFGVAFSVEVPDAALLPAVRAALPPGHEPVASAIGLPRFSLLPAPSGAGFRVCHEDELVADAIDLRAALEALDGRLRPFIAAHAPDLVFVHAGVVASGGRAVVLPGPTRAGKTALVVALLRAGATYYSDEFAVLDPQGRVLPYAKPLSVRSIDGAGATRVEAAALGASTGAGPAPIAVIAATRFVDGESWAPHTRTAADGALLLLAHAGQVRADPERVLETVHRAAQGAVVLEGPRGDAGPVAAALLASL
jgi:hypothetical protein